jgi:hypothetical protein
MSMGLSDPKRQMLLRTTISGVLLAWVALPLSASTLVSHVAVERSFASAVPAWDGPTIINFNDLTSLTTSNYIGGSDDINGKVSFTWAGVTNPFVTGNVSGQYAPPTPLDDTRYLTIGSPGRPNQVTVEFLKPVIYFGFYMGSPDSYNSLDVYGADGFHETYSGAALLNPANGDQSLGAFVNFNASGGTITRIEFGSSQAAFEIDNFAYATSTPEPISVFLIGGGLLLLGSKRIRRRFHTDTEQ